MIEIKLKLVKKRITEISIAISICIVTKIESVE